MIFLYASEYCRMKIYCILTSQGLKQVCDQLGSWNLLLIYDIKVLLLASVKWNDVEFVTDFGFNNPSSGSQAIVLLGKELTCKS